MTEMALALSTDLERRLEAIRDALASCVAVDDARDLADQAAAMQAYARRARLSREALNYAAEVKLRAERRAGQLLRDMEKAPGHRFTGGSSLLPPAVPPTLADVGISKTQSARWQAIARIPAPAFDAYLARYRQGAQELVSQGVYDLAREYRDPAPPPMPADRPPSPVSPSGDGPIPGAAPYYAEPAAGIWLYCGDARDLAPCVAADVLITDPPYGVALGTSKTTTGLYRNGRAGYAEDADTPEDWAALVPPLLARLIPTVRRAAIWAGPHLWEPPMPKPVAVGGIYCPAAMGRHAWGFKNFLPVLFYGKDPRQEEGGCYPTVKQSSATAAKNGHPCPKPLEWLHWLVERATRRGECVLDPFAGSGTTLQAAKSWGRPAVGIEIEARYCEIAARALQQMLDLPLEEMDA